MTYLTIFSLNFLLFAIFFPITSIIILSIIYNSIKEESLIVVGIGLFLSLIFAIIFLKIKIYFVLFLILYILAHLILCLIAKKTSEKNMFNQTTNYLSKLTIFLVIGLFISSALYILPEQSKSRRI